MSTLAAPLPFASVGEEPSPLGGLTLEGRLDGAWQEIRGHGAVDCPVCGDRMDHCGVVGHCRGCGSRLR